MTALVGHGPLFAQGHLHITANTGACCCCPETTLEISWNSRAGASPCSGEGGCCVSVHKVPRMGERGERHTKSVVKRNESRQLATAECRLCRAASFIGAQTGGRFMLSNKPNWKWSTGQSPASRLQPLVPGRVCGHLKSSAFPHISLLHLSSFPPLFYCPSSCSQTFPFPWLDLSPSADFSNSSCHQLRTPFCVGDRPVCSKAASLGGLVGLGGGMCGPFFLLLFC